MLKDRQPILFRDTFIHLKASGYNNMFLFFSFTKGNNFFDFLFSLLDDKVNPSKVGSALKGKHLLL